MSRKYPGTPEPEEIPELLEHYREAERTDKEEDAAFYFDGLSKGTSDFKELFRAHPPENHPALWEAIYTADNDEWCYNLPSGALLSLFCDYAELFRGACPAFRLLRNWIGHGFGYQGVRQDPRLSVAGRGQKKRALVPGYGRGLDALALAKVFGYEVVGVDVSESALESARVLEEEVTKIELLHRNPTQVKNSRMRFWMRMIQSSDWVKRRELSKPILWREADFLSENCFKDGEKFDLIVDNYVSTGCSSNKQCGWCVLPLVILTRPRRSSSLRCIPRSGRCGLRKWLICWLDPMENLSAGRLPPTRISVKVAHLTAQHSGFTSCIWRTPGTTRSSIMRKGSSTCLQRRRQPVVPG